MKTLEEVLKEINENEELQNGFKEAADNDKVVDFLKEQGCEETLEEIVEYVMENDKASAELTEEELVEVAGGRKKKCVTLFGKKLCI